MANKTYIVLSLVLTLILMGCGGKTVYPGNIADKTYVYEKDGFGGDFAITINSDGSFRYYEGYLSSYIGNGTWELKEDVLCLSDDENTGNSFKNYFIVDGESLVFTEENSSNFMYVKVSDGEKFLAAD